MTDKEYEYDLFWHALFYRTVMTAEANDRWLELVACHERIIASKLAEQKEACANKAEEFEDECGHGKAQKIADAIRAMEE